MRVFSRQLNQLMIINDTIEFYVVNIAEESVQLVVLGLPDERVRKIELQTGETAEIITDISITLIQIRGDKVRLGLEAPRETTIHRGEV